MQKGSMYFFCTQVHRVFLDLYTNYTTLGQNSRFHIYRKKSRQKITTESPSLCTNKHQHNQWKLRLLKQIEEKKKKKCRVNTKNHITIFLLYYRYII